MRLILLLVLLSFSGALCAQTPSVVAPHQIPKVPEGIVIDGQLDDTAWASAGEFDVAYETSPGDNIAAPVTTRVRIGYTETALYVFLPGQRPEAR